MAAGGASRPAPPGAAPAPPGPEDESGRGLVLVDALAAEWGTELLPWGKRVWAELSGEGEG
ncbi:hypothetical protein AB8B12_08570 [Streptomyces sp. PGLac3x]